MHKLLRFIKKYSISSATNPQFKGFTLVEMLLSLGILSILTTVLLGAFGNIVDVQLESKAQSTIDQDGRYILAKFSYDFQKMDKITDQILKPTSSELGVSKDTLQIKVNSINYTYTKDASNNLQLVNNSTGSVNVLNSIDTTVESLSFKRLGVGDNNDTVQIKITLKSKIVRPSGQETRNYQTTLSMP